MKKITLISLFLILAFNYLLAQSPQTFKYQAVARDASGVVLADQNISFLINILEGSAGGTSVYAETHTALTNQFGLVNLEIGNGTIVSGIFEDINWGSNLFFLQIEMDETGGTNYQLMGTSQLLSVPYALNAASLTLTSPTGETYEVKADKYGNMVMQPTLFNCGETYYDTRDGQVYNTVKLANQCWMKENLNYETGNSWCHNDLSERCTTYGRLYDWETIMNGSAGSNTIPSGVAGICPDGWHVPSDIEWCSLSQYTDEYVDCEVIGLTGNSVGDRLKSTNLWTSGGFDIYGFAALPGGARHADGTHDPVEESAYFWTSSDTDFGIYRAFYSNSFQIDRNVEEKSFGFSLRCVRDYTNQDPAQPSNPSPADGSIDIGASNVELSWICTDPDDDNLFYKVYFGTDPDPPLVKTSLTETTFNAGILSHLEVYYWKIIAYDGLGGSAESNIWSFTTLVGFNCGDLLIDPRDSHQYTTAQIGTQCWMTQNIDYTVGNSTCYDDDLNNCLTYGRLYAYDDAVNACPPGWHLPEDNEWCSLTQFIDATVGCSSTGFTGFDAGIKMKSTTGWQFNGNGTDEFSFNALPAGLKDENGDFYALGNSTFFWSSTVFVNDVIWAWILQAGEDNIDHDYHLNTRGYSVRCIKD